MPKLSPDFQRDLSVFAWTLLTFSICAHFSIAPRRGEQFYEFYLLGNEGRPEGYFLGDEPVARVGTLVEWRLNLTNLMGSVQYAVVKIKLDDGSSNPPNKPNNIPAPLPTIVELRKILATGETAMFNMIWAVTSIEEKGNTTWIIFRINGLNARVSTSGGWRGKRFRLIFELWTFDTASHEFIFGWRSWKGRYAAWLSSPFFELDNQMHV